MRLSNKVALITGGGSGIGKEMALLFAREGAGVVVADMNLQSARAVAGRIGEQGGRALAVKVNVTETNEVKQMVEESLKFFGGIDILCNNAGIEAWGSVVDCPEEDWLKSFAVNVYGVFLCSKYTLPRMNDGGAVINMGSVAGVVGIPGMAAYCAAKGAVVELTRQMAVDFASRKIRVNCICPGTTMTPLGERLLGTDTDQARQQVRLAKYPLKRFGDPDEIAHAALFLSSDEALYITGAVLAVDGGMTAW